MVKTLLANSESSVRGSGVCRSRVPSDETSRLCPESSNSDMASASHQGEFQSCLDRSTVCVQHIGVLRAWHWCHSGQTRMQLPPPLSPHSPSHPNPHSEIRAQLESCRVVCPPSSFDLVVQLEWLVFFSLIFLIVTRLFCQTCSPVTEFSCNLSLFFILLSFFSYLQVTLHLLITLSVLLNGKGIPVLLRWHRGHADRSKPRPGHYLSCAAHRQQRQQENETRTGLNSLLFTFMDQCQHPSQIQPFSKRPIFLNFCIEFV